MDSTDWTILEALQEDARIGYAELGRRVGLSAPTVTERVRRLEDEGVITGYHAAVNPAALGMELPVFIRMNVGNKEYAKFREIVKNMPRILECHHLTGESAFLLRAQVESVGALETLIGRLSVYGQTSTSLVLSTVLPRRVIGPQVSK